MFPCSQKGNICEWSHLKFPIWVIFSPIGPYEILEKTASLSAGDARPSQLSRHAQSSVQSPTRQHPQGGKTQTEEPLGRHREPQGTDRIDDSI